jgi:hypothetical protein
VFLLSIFQMHTILNTQKDKTNYCRTVVLYTIVVNSSKNPGVCVCVCVCVCMCVYIYIYIYIYV